MMEVTLYAEKRYGGGTPWIARIIGTHPKWRINRHFLPVQRSMSRSGRTGYASIRVTTPGLYECAHAWADGTRREYYLVIDRGDRLAAEPVPAGRIHGLAEMLDKGATVDALWAAVEDPTI